MQVILAFTSGDDDQKPRPPLDWDFGIIDGVLRETAGLRRWRGEIQVRRETI